MWVDAVESIVGEVLRWDGYWVHNSYKVELSPQDKREIGKPTMPRPGRFKASRTKF